MTRPNFPPADQCTAEDLEQIALGVAGAVRTIDPGDLGPDYAEALCRLVGDLNRIITETGRERAETARMLAASEADNRALQERVAALANERDDVAARLGALMLETDVLRRDLEHARDHRDDLIARDGRHIQARERLGKLASDALTARDRMTADLAAARQAIASREDEIARVNNDRQAEVDAAAAERERADEAAALVEVHEAIARAALAVATRTAPVSLAELVHAVDGRLSRALVRERQLVCKMDKHVVELEKRLEDTALLVDQQRETREANDRIRGAFADACLGVTGQTVEQVNIQLDAELAAHPEPGPLHHARDQREQDGGL